MRRVLVIDDDAATNDRLRDLICSMPDVTVEQAHDRATAERMIRSATFDLAVVDIDLGHPKDRYAGVALLTELSTRGCTTLIVSGMPADHLRGVTLTLHAYDFLSKPINDLDFMVKVEHAFYFQASAAQGDRMGSQAWPDGLSEDSNRKPNLLWKGRPVQLSLTELGLVMCLIGTPGRVVEHERLAKVMPTAISPRAIATHITSIRKRFRDVDPNFDEIDPEPGQGYVWKTGR